MADLDDGYTRIANEILERMATVKLSPTQYRLIFVIWRYTYGFKRKQHELSLNFLAESTGCDRRQIQRELKDLEDKRIIIQRIEDKKRVLGFNKNCDEWSSPLTQDVGETTNTPIGETTNTLEGGIGETTNIGIGETTNTPIGETTNKERYLLKKDLKILASSTGPPQNFEELAAEIENHFIMRRGKGTTLSNEDLIHLQQMIVIDQIPLQIIKDSIDQAFEHYKPRHRFDEIRSISYCLPSIYDEWTKLKQRVLPITENVPSEPVALGQARKGSKQSIQSDFLKQYVREVEHDTRGSCEIIHGDQLHVPELPDRRDEDRSLVRPFTGHAVRDGATKPPAAYPDR